MVLTFQSATLDSDSPDREAKLVFRDDRLLAVLSCLSDIHPDLAGQWYIEAMFGDIAPPLQQTFRTLAEFEAWVAEAI